MEELEGKVAVVTGAASGIGLAMAHAWAAQGMRVVLADVEVTPLEEATRELVAKGAEALAVPTDVRDAHAVEALASRTFERFGTAHVICNNAGVLTYGYAWSIGLDRFRWLMDVNFFGVVHGIQAFVPRMIEQGEGHVVNTASAAGLYTVPRLASYSASKYAVVALTEALANDLHANRYGHVGTSVLCPGLVRTGIFDSERNRPPGVAPVPVTNASAAPPKAGSGMDPAHVADTVVDAVRTRRFYVFPDESVVEASKRRTAKIETYEAPLV